MIYVVGIGPGSKKYILPEAFDIVGMCDIVIGSERQILPFQDIVKEKVVVKLDAVVATIEKYKNSKDIALLVSGDPGLYSYLRLVSERYNSDEYKVIPGISSIQAAYSKLGKIWQNVEIINLHGRPIENLSKLLKVKNREAAILTDKKQIPERIAEWLLNKGMENRKVFICSNLSYEDEEIIETNLNDLSKQKTKAKLCIMILE